ncbi:MAG: type III pantothenate kinase [Saprospiraceae bacterium]|nr:type III pantothenate kinase [Saprospiraceae bacterium]
MILAVDIGNSNIVLSVFFQDEWKHTFRYETKGVREEMYYEMALRQILMEWDIHYTDIQYAAISSVVPDLNHSVKEAVTKIFLCPVFLLGPEIFKNIDIDIPLPYEIGSDLVANVYAALNLYHDKVIVADFGTALSFVVANKKEGILGVTIAPGLKTAAQALGTQTAQLPVVPLVYPDSPIGKDTVTAIQAGIMVGYTGLFSEIIHEIKKVTGQDYKVIVTGGHSGIISRIHEKADYTDKNLTLDGIRLLAAFVFEKRTDLLNL